MGSRSQINYFIPWGGPYLYFVYFEGSFLWGLLWSYIGFLGFLDEVNRLGGLSLADSRCFQLPTSWLSWKMLSVFLNRSKDVEGSRVPSLDLPRLPGGTYTWRSARKKTMGSLSISLGKATIFFWSYATAKLGYFWPLAEKIQKTRWVLLKKS